MSETMSETKVRFNDCVKYSKSEQRTTSTETINSPVGSFH